MAQILSNLLEFKNQQKQAFLLNPSEDSLNEWFAAEDHYNEKLKEISKIDVKIKTFAALELSDFYNGRDYAFLDFNINQEAFNEAPAPILIDIIKTNLLSLNSLKHKDIQGLDTRMADVINDPLQFWINLLPVDPKMLGVITELANQKISVSMFKNLSDDFYHRAKYQYKYIKAGVVENTQSDLFEWLGFDALLSERDEFVKKYVLKHKVSEMPLQEMKTLLEKWNKQVTKILSSEKETILLKDKLFQDELIKFMERHGSKEIDSEMPIDKQLAGLMRELMFKALGFNEYLIKHMEEILTFRVKRNVERYLLKVIGEYDFKDENQMFNFLEGVVELQNKINKSNKSMEESASYESLIRQLRYKVAEETSQSSYEQGGKSRQFENKLLLQEALIGIGNIVGIENYWNKKNSLSESLKEISDQIDQRLRPNNLVIKEAPLLTEHFKQIKPFLNIEKINLGKFKIEGITDINEKYTRIPQIVKSEDTRHRGYGSAPIERFYMFKNPKLQGFNYSAECTASLSSTFDYTNELENKTCIKKEYLYQLTQLLFEEHDFFKYKSKLNYKNIIFVNHILLKKVVDQLLLLDNDLNTVVWADRLKKIVSKEIDLIANQLDEGSKQWYGQLIDKIQIQFEKIQNELQKNLLEHLPNKFSGLEDQYKSMEKIFRKDPNCGLMIKGLNAITEHHLRESSDISVAGSVLLLKCPQVIAFVEYLKTTVNDTTLVNKALIESNYSKFFKDTVEAYFNLTQKQGKIEKKVLISYALAHNLNSVDDVMDLFKKEITQLINLAPSYTNTLSPALKSKVQELLLNNVVSASALEESRASKRFKL